MLPLILKVIAPVFVLVGVLHLVLGLGADQMLGAEISAASLADPVLQSQNRFYGVAFTLYGALLLVCATDLKKYQTVLRCLLGVFFLAGAARMVPIMQYGLPSGMVLILMASELALPPIIWVWLRASLKELS